MRVFCLLCLTEHELSFQWYGLKETVESVHKNVTLRYTLRHQADSWIFALPLTCLHEKQVVSQLPFARALRVLLSWVLFCVHKSMPKLRETYLQIQERNAREIRQRTSDRIRALQQVKESVVGEDLSETSITTAEQSYTVPILVCIIFVLVLVCLWLTQHI
jgi:hypothetical protein